jgi:DNA-binding protein HU-beta
MKQNTHIPKSTNKKILISSISEISGLSREDSTQALNAVMKSITKCLNDGKEVRLPGFGTFRVHLRPESDGRNPRTGKPIKIPAMKVPKFRPSLVLKDDIS